MSKFVRVFVGLMLVSLLTGCLTQGGSTKWLISEPVEAMAAEKLAVWAVPGAYRIFPVGDECLDVNAGTLARVRTKNAVWNGAMKTVTLRGARREVVSFQLIIEPLVIPIASVDVVASDLRGEAGTIAAENVRLFLEAYVPEQDKFYPDILVPFEAGGVHPFSIPHKNERLAAVQDQSNQAVWVDVEIPADAKPGTYEGVIGVLAGRKLATKIAVRLEVLDLTIPLRRNVEIVLDTYGYAIRFKYKNRDELLQVERQFHQLAHDHRMFINVIRYPQMGVGRSVHIPTFSRDEKGNLVVDWSWWDKRFGPYLDGSAFKDGHPQQQFCLYFNAFWPVEEWPERDHIYPEFKSAKKEKYERIWMEYAHAYIKHFKKKGWDKVKFTIKFNHNARRIRSRGGGLQWNTDTPVTKADYESVAYYADLVHRAFKDMPPLTMRHRIDTNHSFCKAAGCDNTIWDKCRAAEIIKDSDMLFFYWKHGVSHLDEIRKLNAKGKESYIYRHGWKFIEPCPIFKGLGWILWAGDLDGYNAYNNPHADLKQRRNRPWDNYVMYLGWEGKRKAAFPAIRLKLQRASLYDYEYLKMANEKDAGGVAKIVKRIVEFKKLPEDGRGRVFTGPVLNQDPAAYYRAREQLIGILSGR